MARAPEKWDLEVDIVAVGSSSGGMTAAIYAHDAGLKAVVLEKANSIGGGCGVLIWIPVNHYMREAGIADSREAAIDYLRHTAVGRGEEGKMEAYVAYGAEAVDYVEQRTPLKFAMTMGAGGADYRTELPGGMMEGRHLGPDPLVMAQRLMEGATRFPELNKVRQSPHGELGGLPEQMWVGSKAYYGGLALGCMERGIDILLETPGRELVMQDGRVVGVRAERGGRGFYVKANRGVVLATGGFEWNAEMNRRFIHGPELKAITKPSNAGDGHIMGMEVGAAVALMDHSVWLPAVRLPGDMSDGQQLFRLFLGCGKPGDILVNKKGQRFCDESFFPDIGRGWITYDSHEQTFPNVPNYFICDQAYRDKYAVATAAPGTKAPDWLAQADTLRGLAQKLGIDADGLEQTVARFNRNAKEGKDPDFQRGDYKYERMAGAGGPKAVNPCIGPIEKPPFYGVEALPATAGHQGGLVTNENAQVISVRGQAIPGLYACSNTAAHLTCGFSYNSGLNLGQSLVFGYLAAKHIVSSRGA